MSWSRSSENMTKKYDNIEKLHQKQFIRQGGAKTFACHCMSSSWQVVILHTDFEITTIKQANSLAEYLRNDKRMQGIVDPNSVVISGLPSTFPITFIIIGCVGFLLLFVVLIFILWKVYNIHSIGSGEKDRLVHV